MVLTILGSGTSTGVPLICCSCAVCTSKNPKNKRLRTSAWVTTRGKSILIDTSTDFRQQALGEGIGRVDAVLFTHPHADHVHGIDDLRSFNFVQKGPIPIFSNAWTNRELLQKFRYIFKERPKEGGGVALLEPHVLSGDEKSFKAAGVKIVPIVAYHGSKPVLGFRFNRIAYVTDCSYIPNSSLDRLKGLSVLVLDCLRLRPHGTHFNLDQALDIISMVKPKKTVLTHLGHDLDYKEWQEKLPRGVSIAFDGLKIKG